MSEIIIPNAVVRDRDYDYFVDKQGNLCKEKYNYFKDKWTLVTLAIIILGVMYYIQSQESLANVNNLDTTCMYYQELSYQWKQDHPNQNITGEIIKDLIKNYKPKVNDQPLLGINTNGVDIPLE